MRKLLFPLKINPLWPVLLAATLSLGGIYFLFLRHLDQKKAESTQYLQARTKEAGLVFRDEVNKLGIFVLGLRTHLQEVSDVHTASSIQHYLQTFLEHTAYNRSIIINSFNPSHTFLYSVSNESIHPNDLVGKNISDIRDSSIIHRMERVMAQDGLHAQPPLNLIEGFVGLPINFRVEKAGKVIGYLTPISDVRNIISKVHELDKEGEFDFQFSVRTDPAQYFDTDRVYTSTYKGWEGTRSHEEVEFLLYRLRFSVALAYRHPPSIRSAEFFQNTYVILLVLFIIFLLAAYLHYLNFRKTTALIHSNETLKHRNFLLKQFVFAAAHDLKQPLVNIECFHDLLGKKIADSLNMHEKSLMQVIGDNARNLKGLLGDLLTYSTVFESSERIQAVPLNELMERMEAQFAGENIALEYENLPIVMGMPKLLSILFSRLISNGLKFNSSQHKRISIEAFSSQGFVEIRIRDNGIGIAQPYLEDVFRAFVRLYPDRYEGSGLGLSICREIVQLHGGTIRADSYQGEGAVFMFNLKLS